MLHIKNIIFDYGNVIFLIDFKRIQKSFSELGVRDADTFFSHAAQDSIFNLYEAGLISSAAFRDGIRDLAQLPEITDEQIDEAWNSLLVGVPPANHEILLKAKEKYRTFLLSNNNEIHYTWIQKYLQTEFNLVSNAVFFERDYYSHLMKMRKPNAEIFQQVLTENNLEISETLFIDDSPQHIATAKQLGLYTHLLTFPETLEDFMYSSGLLEH